MRESNKFHRSNRKWTARILAYLLAFAMTLMSIPVDMVSAENGGMESLSSGENNTEGGSTYETLTPEDTRPVGEFTELILSEAYEGIAQLFSYDEKFYELTYILRTADKKVSITEKSSIANGDPAEVVSWHFKTPSGEVIDLTNYEEYCPFDGALIPGDYYFVPTVRYPDGTEVTGQYVSRSYYWQNEEFSAVGNGTDQNGTVIVHYTGEPVCPQINSKIYVDCVPTNYLLGIDGYFHTKSKFAKGILKVVGDFNSTEITPAGQKLHTEIQLTDSKYRVYFDELRGKDTDVLAAFDWRVWYDEFDSDEKDYIRKSFTVENARQDGSNPNLYWCGMGDTIQIGTSKATNIFELVKKEIEFSKDGVNWIPVETQKNNKIEFEISDRTDITYYIKSDLHNYYEEVTFKVDVDNVVPTGNLIFRGAEFDDVYLNDNEEYSNQFFLKPGAGGTETIGFEVPQKISGAKITEVAMTITGANWTVANFESEDAYEDIWRPIKDEELADSFDEETSMFTGSWKVNKSTLLDDYEESGCTYGSNVVWMRIKDASNNTTYISSDNVIIYDDLDTGYDGSYTEGDPSINYYKSEGGDLRLYFSDSDRVMKTPVRDSATGEFINLKDFIASVAISTINNGQSGAYEPLSKEIGQFSVGYNDGYGEGDTEGENKNQKNKAYLLLEQGCFDSSTLTTEFDVRVELNPYGISYVDKHSSATVSNDKPKYVYFHIKMGKGQSEIEIAESNAGYTKVYDGKPYNDLSFITTEGGRVYQYHAKLKKENGVAVTDYEEYTEQDWLDEDERCDAGEYFVYAYLDFPVDSVYDDSWTTGTYTITKRKVSANIKAKPKNYDGGKDAILEEITVNTAIDDKELYLNPEAFLAQYADKKVADNVKVTVTGTVENFNVDGGVPAILPEKKDVSDKYENYEITFVSTQSSIQPQTVDITFLTAAGEDIATLDAVYGDSTNTPQKLITDALAVENGLKLTNVVTDEKVNVIASLSYTTTATYSSTVGNDYVITAKSNNAEFSHNYIFNVTTKVAITPKPILVNWTDPQGTEFTYNQLEHKITATVKNLTVNTDKTALTYELYKKNENGTYVKVGDTFKATEVGEYKTVITNTGNVNYMVNTENQDPATACSLEWKIVEYVTDKTPTVEQTKGEDTGETGVMGWYKNSELTIKAPTGYLIANGSTNGTLQFDLSFTVDNLQDGKNTVYYYLKNIDYSDPNNLEYIGCVTSKQELTIAVDTVAPTGNVELKDKTDKIYNAINNLAGYFFGKEIVSFKVTFADVEPTTADGLTRGVSKVEYGIIEETSPYENIVWQTYDKDSGDNFTTLIDQPMSGNSIPKVVYVRITDKAGNVTEMNSAGIVVYKDAVVTTTSVTYTKYSTSGSWPVSVTFNNNTVKSAVIKKEADGVVTSVKELTENVHYEVTNTGILFRQAAFDDLATINGQEYTPYKICITFNPLGKEYLGNGTAPAELEVILNVSKARPSLEVDPFYKVYDGEEISNPNYRTNSTGTVTFTYYKATPQYSDNGREIVGYNVGALLTDEERNPIKPKNAGVYYVQATVGEDANYKEYSSSYVKVEIGKKLVNAYIDTADKYYDGNDDATVEAVRIETGVQGDTFKYASGLVANFSAYYAGSGRDVYIGEDRSTNDDAAYFEKIQWDENETTALPSNYILEYHIEKADILKRPLGIYVKQVNAKYNESISFTKDDFTITPVNIDPTKHGFPAGTPQNLANNESINNVLSMSYISDDENRKEVLYDNDENVIPHDVMLNEFTIACNNYKLIVVDEEGNTVNSSASGVKLLIYQKDLTVDWQASQTSQDGQTQSEAVSLKDESSKRNSDGTEKKLQYDTVIYNGKEYNVAIGGLNGIVSGDTVEYDEVTNDSHTYAATNPGAYTVEAKELKALATQTNKNHNYIIPDDTPSGYYQRTDYNRNFTWKIKYLDEYYTADQITDGNDECGSIYVNGKRMKTISTAGVTGEGNVDEAYAAIVALNDNWIKPADVVDENGTKTGTKIEIKPRYAGAYQIVQVTDVTGDGKIDAADFNPATAAWASSIVMNNPNDGEHEFAYAIMDGNGYITSVRKTKIFIDSTSPTAEMTVTKDENNKVSILNVLENLLDWFFSNEKIIIDIAATDIGGSGLAGVYYQRGEVGSTGPVSNWNLLDWTAQTDSDHKSASVSLDKGNKTVIYIRILDNAGNSKILGTDGLVIYDDAEGTVADPGNDDGGTRYVRYRKDIKEVCVDLTSKDHEIASVYYKLPGETTAIGTLGETYYSITDETEKDGKVTMTLTTDFLETLSVGEYDVYVKYAPLGQAWEDGTSYGDTPTETLIPIKIMRSQGTVEIDEDYASTMNGETEVITHIYDGAVVENPKFTTTNSAEAKAGATFKFSSTKDENGKWIDFSEDKRPVNAGTYCVQVTVPQDDDYTEAVGYLEFTIDKAKVEATIPVKDKVYDTSVTAEADGPTFVFDTTINNEKLEVATDKFTLTFADKNVAYSEADEVIAKDVAVTYTNNEIVLEGVNGSNPENYVVTYVAEQAVITPKPAKITVVEKTVVYGDNIPSFEANETGVYDTDSIGTYTLTSAAQRGAIPRIYDVIVAHGAEYNPNYQVEEINSTLTITKRVVDIAWVNNEGDDPAEGYQLKTTFDYDGLAHNVIPVITNVYKEDGIADDVSLVYDGHTATSVEEYETVITALDGSNSDCYALPQLESGAIDTDKTEKAWKIQYVDSGEVADFDEDKWYKGDKVQIKAPEDYQIATEGTAEASWGDYIEHTADSDADGTEVTYYLKDANGAITPAKTVVVKKDSVAPGGNIKVKGTSVVKEFLNTISFGLFYKLTGTPETLVVKVEGTDSLSGIKSIEYLYADNFTYNPETDEEADWNSLTVEDGEASIEMVPSKAVIFVKITDNADNFTVMNSDGVVVYVDSEITTEGDLAYTKDRKNTDITVQIQTQLKGNTVKAIKLDNEPIDEKYYTVQDNPAEEGYGLITIHNEYLQTETVSEGRHTLTISYNPQGETYKGAEANAPVDTTIDLVVSKNTTVPININTDQFYYTGKPIKLEVITPSTSTPVVTYAKKVDGVYGEYTTEVPREVGTYRVKVTTEADSWYEKGEESFVIDINPCAVKIQVVAREIEYGTDIPTIDFTVVSPTSLPNGATKDDLDVELTVECEINAFGKVNAGKYDVEMTDWNENYDIDFVERSNRNALVVKPRAITVDWGTTSFDYDATEHGVSPIITNLIGNESCELELDGTLSATAADTYSAEIEDVTNDNYTVKGVSDLVCEWTISYNAADAAKEATLVGTIVNGWYTDEVVLLVAPEGYEISDQGTDRADDKWDATISISQEGQDQEVTYYLRNTQTNAITAAKTVVISLDATAPEGTIKLDSEESVFERFMNMITFGLFFKDDVDVEISGRDAYSGVDSIKYLLSDKELTKAEAEALALDETKWTTDDSFSITEEQKVIVYAMITDKAGHFAIINTDGVVVYTDVDVKDISATYTKTTMTDVIADVTLNGNTVNAVIFGEDELEQGTHYDVDGDKIILKGTYLDTLDASAVPYNFEVTYYPGGVVDAPVDVESTSIKVTVQKQTVPQGDAPVFSVEDSIVYDGAGVDEVTATYSGVSDGKCTVYYKLKDSDDAFTTTKPVNAGTYIAKAVVAESDNYNAIEVEQEFTIEPITIDDIVWPVENTYIYTEEPYTVTATVPSGVLSGETLNIVYFGNVGTEVGVYTATIESLGNSNYKLSTEAEKTFVWYIELGSVSEEILEDLKPDSTPTEEGWYDDYVTIDAPEGTLIRVQGTDEWKDKVVIVDDGENTVVFEIKDESTGFVSETEEMTFPIDRNEPDVTVTIAGKEYTEDATEDDPSVFAKDKIVIPLDGDDTTSDVTVYYQVVPEGQEYDENGTWTDASTTNNQVVIVAPEKATVYVKAIDEAGNETVVKTTDIVVYKDAAQETTEMEFTKTSDEPVIAEVVLNGNEIADPIKVEGTDIDGNSVEEVLTCPDDYTVDENGKITFNQDSLDELLPAGEYDVIISYKPLGQTYEEAEGNEAPADTIVKLVVEKADSIVNENELTETDFAKVYDGNAVTNPTLEQNDKSQTIVYEYKVKGAGDNTYSELPPTAVGEYTVRVTAEANAYYNSNVVEIDFAISKREVSVSAGTITATANSEVTVAVENVVVTDLAEGQSVQSVAINGTTTTVTDNGTYTLSDLVIVDADGADVTANYEITYTSGKLIVEHDTTLAPSEMAVEMLTEYTANDSLSKNDIEVTISYTDGYEKVVTDYVSNIDEIDMSKVGQKTVVISYTENGETITEEVTIMVAHNPESRVEQIEATLTDNIYAADEALDLSEMIVKASYADGYEELITGYTTNAAAIDMSTVGQKTLVVSYTKNNHTVTDEVIITVTHNTASKPIDMDVTMSAYEFVAGTELKVNDLLVEVTYEDEFKQTVTNYTSNIDAIDMSKVGEKTVVITYTENGETLTKEVTINVTHSTESVLANVDATLADCDYVAGEALDLSGLTVKATYADNYEELVTDYVTNAAEIDMTKVGEKNLVVSYTKNNQTVTDEIVITVAHDPASKPEKVDATMSSYEFVAGDELTTDDILVKVTYADGYEDVVTDFVSNIDEIDMTQVGEKTLVVSYNKNGQTVTDEIVFTVVHDSISVPTNVDATLTDYDYVVGESLNLDDMIVKVTYADGFTKVVTEGITTNAESLNMNEAGTKELKVSYTENGVTVTETIEITVAPNVDKDEANLTAEDFEQTYNGEPVDNPDLTINNNGQTVTYEYKVKDADDSTYTSEPPTNAGDYTVRITAVGTDKYPENVREIDFTIEPKEVTVSAGVLTALSNETVTVDPSTLTTIGLLDGHYIEAIDVNADTSIITTNGTYTLANAVVKDAAGNDVTSNYNYNYGTGTLIVEHNSSLAPTSLRIEKQTVGYKVGDVFTDDDVRVFAVYSDGYETEVTDYVTNASEIDMSTASMKVFEVSCDVDGTVLTNEIYIDVTVDPGRVGFEVIHVEDAPETAVKNDAEELKDVVLTDEDREMVATGEDYNIYLEVKNIEDEVPPADKAIVEELMTEKYEDSVLAMFIDVSLYKKIGESPATYVKNVDTPIVISIKIPDELISEDPEIARTYYIVRVHEGVPTLISGTFNKEDNTFVFATDRFSTYAIMYKDVVVTDDKDDDVTNNPTDDKDDVTNNPTDDKDDVTNNPTDDKDDDKTPTTGDNTNAMLWILLMTAGCGMVVFGKRKKSNF